MKVHINQEAAIRWILRRRFNELYPDPVAITFEEWLIAIGVASPSPDHIIEILQVESTEEDPPALKPDIITPEDVQEFDQMTKASGLEYLFFTFRQDHGGGQDPLG